MSRALTAILGLAMVGIMSFGSLSAQAGATKQELLDACFEWGPAFCESGGTGGAVSDIPAFLTGKAIFNEDNPSEQVSQMLTVMVNKSAADTDHQVFICPGAGNFGVSGSGFTGCAMIGAFTTNKQGQGHFHWEPASETPIDGCTYNVLVMNIANFGSVLATAVTNGDDDGDLFPCL